MSIDFAAWFNDTVSTFAGGPRQNPPPPAAEAPAPAPTPPLSRKTEWTLERISSLGASEIRQLLANAERLNDAEIAARCAQVLKERPDREAKSTPRIATGVAERLVSRATAFGRRGVLLANRFWSRSGATRDGEIVFALWAADVHYDKAGASHLLWAPNVDGSRPWSDKPAGQERLEHCRRALKRGSALGLLVYGERIEGVLPDDRAARMDGIDSGVIVLMRVERRGEEWWATWKDGRA